jgi:fatty acid desaturase
MDKMTKIDGKYYDLSKFNHPGGDVALSHTFGRDSTILFKSYHQFTSNKSLLSIIKKYEIPKLPDNYKLLTNEENVPQFKFDTKFGSELKKEIGNYFTQISKEKNIHILESIKSPPKRWLQILIMNIFRCLSFYQLLCGDKIGIFTYSISSWLFCTNSFHDACHFSLSRNENINKFFSYSSPLFCSPLTWYHHHNIGHHSYTNIKNKDPDLYHNSYFKRTIQSTKYKKIYRYQHITLFIEWFLSYIGLVIKPNIEVLNTSMYHNIIPSRYEKMSLLIESIYIFIGISLSFLPFALYDNIYDASLLSFSPYILHSLLFMINSQITHIHTPCMVEEIDWYKHQVITATNHSIGSNFAFIFSGGLNYQIEHHLFPNINHYHLPKIQPIVKKVCQKHNVIYKEFTGYWDAFLSYFKHIKLMSYLNKKEV